MILYHPAKDVNHCSYRMLSLLLHIEHDLTVENLRLLDFYYSFPHLLKEIQPWPSDIREYKPYITKVPEPYEKISNKKLLFFEMADIQKTSIALLHAKGLIKDEPYREGKIVLNEDTVPAELYEKINSDDFVVSKVFESLTIGFMSTAWEGKQGLKFRTGLLEYKYDE